MTEDATVVRDGLRRQAAWNLPGGPVGPPARWDATSNVEGGSGTDERAGLKGSNRINYLHGYTRVSSYATAPRVGVPN